jgi:AraC family transcriptional regulator
MINPALANTVKCEPTGSTGEVIEFPNATLRHRSSLCEPAAASKSALSGPSVRIRPGASARRQAAVWRGVSGEVVQVLADEPFEMGYQGSFHLLIAYQRAVRRDGETIVDGFPRSTLHDLSQKLTFVPAGYRFKEWQNPFVATRATFLFIDPTGPSLDPDVRFSQIQFTPRLLFENSILSETVHKLDALIESGGSSNRPYAEALAGVLAHELIRLDAKAVRTHCPVRGGLAGWQRKTVSTFIDDNLSEQISLATLASLAQLSPYHFSRAFKQAFGAPPNRYHAQRRIERAKSLLAEQKHTITDIALALGFSETSSFSRVFYKFTGRTPRDYRRSII